MSFKYFTVCLMIFQISLYAGLEIKIDKNTDKNNPKIDVPEPTGGAIQLAPKKLLKKGPSDEVLYFSSHDVLHGNLEGVNEGRIAWSKPSIKNNLQVSMQNLRGIKLFKQPAASPVGTRLLLTNDDVIYGEIISLNDDELVMNTWFAGKMSIPRVMVKEINPSLNSSKPIIEGFGNLGDWSENGSWKLENATLSGSSGQISRKLNLADKCRVKVNAKWDSYPNFSVTIFGKDPEEDNDHGINLRFEPTRISLLKGTQLSMGSVSYSLRRKNAIKIEFLVDRKKSYLALFVNDKLIKEWKDFSHKPDGNFITFRSNYNTVSFSKFRINRWDGTTKINQSTDKIEDKDQLRFINGDQIAGTIVSIKNNELAFKSDAGEIELPISNINSIRFAQDDIERARRLPDDVKLYFHNGDHLTLRLIALKDHKLLGKSENFGTVALDLNAFIGIEFNIYQEFSEPFRDMLDFF